MEENFSVEPFDKLSILYGADEKRTMLVLNNLKLAGFRTPQSQNHWTKHTTTDIQNLREIPRSTFALRHLYPEKYAAARDTFKMVLRCRDHRQALASQKNFQVAQPFATV
nr:unnamed protein product [Callosobruchus chinensis]